MERGFVKLNMKTLHFAANVESSSFLKQLTKSKKELDISREEMMDVLKIVLLCSGMIPFNKALDVLNRVYK